MTKTVFTDKKKQEFFYSNRFCFFVFFEKIFAEFTENLFVRDRPANTGNRDRQHKKIYELR